MHHEDDVFNPNNVNYENDVENTNNLFSDILFDTKKLDKGYRKFYKKYNKIWKDGKFYKTITIELYLSNGSRIRHAISGEMYDYKVGSKSEDLFFKVKNVSGLLGKESKNLFYNSPEEYEEHQDSIVSTEVKLAWYNKNITARQLMI